MSIVVCNAVSSPGAIRGNIKFHALPIFELSQEWWVIPVKPNDRPAVERGGITRDFGRMQIGGSSFADCTNKWDLADPRARRGLVIREIPGASALHEAVIQKGHCQEILRFVVGRIHSAIGK